jgi:hypothetical protein
MGTNLLPLVMAFFILELTTENDRLN